MQIDPKRFSELDIPVRVNWINDERINQSMFFDLPATIPETLQWFQNIGERKRIDFTFKNNFAEIIAMCGITSISEIHKNGEFYIMVNPDMHGKGIGKKVSIWMYNYAFSILKLHKVYLYTSDDNIVAYKLYEKVGFSLEGIFRQQKWKNGIFQNRRFYGLLRAEWEVLDWRQLILHEY